MVDAVGTLSAGSPCAAAEERQVLVWLPHSYTGRGPAESCVRIIEHFVEAGLKPTLFVNRSRKGVSGTVAVVEAAGGPLRALPYRIVSAVATARLTRMFADAIDRAPAGSIAYFWPDVPLPLVERARRRGLVCVREMINSPLAHAKPILDVAYRAAGLEPSHGITDAQVASETRELLAQDLLFSANAEVDAALVSLGIEPARILRSTFGWVGDRFAPTADASQGRSSAQFRAVFVGLMNVRKGIPVLLEAWSMAGIEGELVLAGTLEPVLQPLVSAFCERPDVTHLGHVDDVAALYRSCDVFVFPTHEEGGPQVTYEAAACGIPVITTPMGAARLIVDGESGRLCNAGDAAALAGALTELAGDPELRKRLAQEAAARVGAFEYRTVGTQRAALLRDACADLGEQRRRGS